MRLFGEIAYSRSSPKRSGGQAQDARSNPTLSAKFCASKISSIFDYLFSCLAPVVQSLVAQNSRIDYRHPKIDRESMELISSFICDRL
jgi:hypothetical protein